MEMFDMMWVRNFCMKVDGGIGFKYKLDLLDCFEII